jgi:hypothetical protein
MRIRNTGCFSIYHSVISDCQCEVTIHQSHPLDYIAFDRTMQDIVYKLVPNLETDEYRRYDLSMRRIFLFGLYTTLNKLSNTRVGYQPLI